MAITLIAGLASMGSAYFVGGVAWSFAAFAIGAGLSLVSRALAPKLNTGSQMGGRSVTTREAAHSRKIVYGRARIGGNIVYLESTGSDNKHLWLVIAVAGHEIDGYESVWFNDEKVWDGGVYQSGWASSGSTSTSPYVYIGFHNGDQTSVDGALDAASTKWTTDHKLLDTAYMVVKLTYDQDRFAQGLPNISTIVRGKKVLDPSDNSTAWSDNPALCAYDYLRDTKYGLGETAGNILTASVITAKGVCDQTVQIKPASDNITQKRYTINGVVDTANSIKSNIEQMLGSMIGRLVYSSGQFEIHAGAYVAPSFTIDESVAVGEITVQTKQSRRNAYNGVKGVFLSEDDNYILADYPAQISSSYATEDGDPIYLDMALPFTTNNIRAQRIAKLALFRSRQQEAITIPCNLSALRFKIGDNINVYNTRFGWTNPSKIFEVVGYSMAFSSDGQIVVNVDAIETAASIWDWTTSDEEVFLGGGEVDLYDGSFAAAPTQINVTSDSFLSDDGTFNSQFKVAWVDADDAFTDHYVVEWKLASASDYFSQTTKSTPFSIVNLVNNASYNVRVKAVNEIGVSSAYIDATETSAIDATAPSLPSSISATAGYKSISLAWTYPSQKDFNNIEIWRSATPTGTYLEVSNVAGGFGAKAEHLDGGLGDAQSYSYKFKSVDLTGNKTSTTDFNNQTAVTQTTDAEVVAVAGKSVYTPFVFRRKSGDPPSRPSGGTFNFGTNFLDPPTDWYPGIPTGTDPVYACNFTFSISGDTGTVTAGQWSVPVISNENGESAVSTFTYPVYRRDTSLPDKPTNGEYDFTDNDIEAPTAPATWYEYIPTGTDPVYVSVAKAQIIGATGTDTNIVYLNPTLAFQDGGIGETGPRNASGYLYYSVSQATTPTKPIATGYDFATGAFTFTGSTGTNWSRTIPQSTGENQQFWASSYLVSESEYETIGSIVFSPPFSSIYFNGLVTFTNLNTALENTGGNITTIDGGLIETNTIVAHQINVDNLSAIQADLGAVTAGSLNNLTNSPTAGSAPTGVQSGTAINLSAGSFTFGNSSSFLYFNTSDGLIQGGLTPFNDTVSIYYQGSSAPSSLSDSSMTYSSTGAYSFTTNPPTGWALGIPSTTDNIYVVQADIGRIGAGVVTASWSQVSLFRTATVTGTSLTTSPSSITFFYANSNSTSPNSYTNTYTVTASGAYSHAMVTNAVVASGTWSSLNSGSVTVNEQSGDTGQFTIGSVTYQATLFNKVWSWTVTHTASGSTVTQSTRSLTPSIQ
jgi:hypothetical protein